MTLVVANIVDILKLCGWQHNNSNKIKFCLGSKSVLGPLVSAGPPHLQMCPLTRPELRIFAWQQTMKKCDSKFEIISWIGISLHLLVLNAQLLKRKEAQTNSSAGLAKLRLWCNKCLSIFDPTDQIQLADIDFLESTCRCSEIHCC